VCVAVLLFALVFIPKLLLNQTFQVLFSVRNFRRIIYQFFFCFINLDKTIQVSDPIQHFTVLSAKFQLFRFPLSHSKIPLLRFWFVIKKILWFFLHFNISSYLKHIVIWLNHYAKKNKYYKKNSFNDSSLNKMFTFSEYLDSLFCNLIKNK
jgi:hypothetical protein